MEKILDVVKDAIKKFQGTKNKEYEKTQKQINELIGALIKKIIKSQSNITRQEEKKAYKTTRKQ
jgi:hypothetical protein